MSKESLSNNTDSEVKPEVSEVAAREEKVLNFWREQHIFQKSLDQDSPQGEFVFYDGPPFATGLPHYGHLLPGTIKDVFPRYKTMRGFRVRRQWGWDTHGLPVENLVEKELGFDTKKEIEDYGIEKFNEKARAAVLRYAADWRRIIPRTGRWVDMEHDYKTMQPSYTESVWWSFQSLYEKDLVYEGFKVMHLCPRCETTLSNFEVSQGYADIKDFAVTVPLALKDATDTYLLIWTTTPWTLPGNTAAAVNPDTEYVTVELAMDEKNGEWGGKRFILAKSRTTAVLGDRDYKIVNEELGQSLVGRSYTPPFDYFIESDIAGKDKAWQVYPAPYVTTEDGTGIVHIAPAFGIEDMELAEKYHIPLIHHVDLTGHFIKVVTDFAGRPVKPKDSTEHDHTETDVEIIKWLAHHGKLFAKEKITHSYPHCWRCDTPLLNYATSSWFVSVTKFKDQLVAENKKIGWVPKEIGDNRFGNWLEGARDWAISRSRFWGAPLPVWKSDQSSDIEVIGSLAELRAKAPQALAELVLVRHGESEKNELNILDSVLTGYPLTAKGRAQAEQAAAQLKESGIDVIYSSPVARAQETAEILARELGLSVIIAPELREIASGEWDGKPMDDPSTEASRQTYFALTPDERHQAKRGKTGESWQEIEDRMVEFTTRTLREHSGQRVLFVTHQGPIVTLLKHLHGWSAAAADAFHDASAASLYAEPLSIYVDLKRGKAFDFHRPYIDDITWQNNNGETMRRIPEVFDTWYESGSMPFASHHYPFRQDTFDPKADLFFPADFISEGLDQTRGWFYSLLVLNTALFDRAPYRHVIVHGLVLAEDGKKMSKRLQNYPDMMYIINRYGADALRYYLVSSPVVRGEPLNFSEQGVDEIVKKLVLRLQNVVSFYELYADGTAPSQASENALDVWVRARLAKLGQEVTSKLDSYQLDRAARPLIDFVEDLSVWYVRRSRDRLKGDSPERKLALETLRYVLLELSKLLAPFTPFLAEEVYGSVRMDNGAESVHLSGWPTFTEVSSSELDTSITQMAEVRQVVRLALEAREKAGIKVRQPLQALRLKTDNHQLENNPDLLELIKEEVNVKSVQFDSSLEEEVDLDTEVTPELQAEGDVRELVRTIQDLRKQAGLAPGEAATLQVEANAIGQEFFTAHQTDITVPTSISDVVFTTVTSGVKVKVREMEFEMKL
jgi:isoleucyl-tRNA synthetase